MIIGIDIDGVLTNLERFQLDYGSKYFFETENKININPNEYEIIDIFNATTENDDKFWKEYLEFYAKKEPARRFASEIIKKLKNDGHQIYIITARFLTDRDDYLGKKMRLIVKKWLKNNKIIYDKIIFSQEDKKNICKENNVDIMIEDAPKNIVELSEVLPKVICFDALYNREIAKDNVIRCYSWYDIYSKIFEIKNN